MSVHSRCSETALWSTCTAVHGRPTLLRAHGSLLHRAVTSMSSPHQNERCLCLIPVPAEASLRAWYTSHQKYEQN